MHRYNVLLIASVVWVNVLFALWDNLCDSVTHHATQGLDHRSLGSKLYWTSLLITLGKDFIGKHPSLVVYAELYVYVSSIFTR